MRAARVPSLPSLLPFLSLEMTTVNVSHIEARLLELSRKQLAIVDDNRRPWAERKPQFEQADAEIKSLLDQHAAAKGIARIEDLTGGAGGLGSIAALPHSSSRGIKALEAAGHRLVGPPSLVLPDAELREMHEAVSRGKSFRAQVKELTSTAGGDLPLTEVVVPPVAFRREPTRIASLIPFTTSPSPVVVFYTTTGTAAADAVAEGAIKPESDINYTPTEGRATKIAHRARATDEALKDIPSFAAVLQQDMVAGVIEAENRELLSAVVGGAHMFPGLLNVAGIGTVTRDSAVSESIPDAIERATLEPRIGGSYVAPDGLVMNPTDWSAIRRTKDSDGRYIVTVDPTTPGAMTLWGLNVVLTTQIPAGTALVGAFADSTVGYIVDGLTVESDRSGDDFDRNKTSLRAEERLILTAPRPAGLVKVTL